MGRIFVLLVNYLHLCIFLVITGNTQNISNSNILIEDLLSDHHSVLVAQKHTVRNNILNRYFEIQDAALTESEQLEIFKEKVEICAGTQGVALPPTELYSSVVLCIKSKELEAERLQLDLDSRTTLRFLGIGARFIANERNCQQRALDSNKSSCFVRAKLRLTPEVIKYSNLIANDGREYENYFHRLRERLKNCLAMRCDKLKTDLINRYRIPLNVCGISC